VAAASPGAFEVGVSTMPDVVANRTQHDKEMT